MKSYKQFNREGTMTREHREVWEAAHGSIPEGFDVDHINGNIHDNRLVNLRLATRSQNIMNSKLSSANRTGLKGLSRKGDGWRGTIRLNYKQYSFTSKDLFEVCCWLFSTRRNLHGEFARNY